MKGQILRWHQEFVAGRTTPTAVLKEQVRRAQKWQSTNPIFIDLHVHPAERTAYEADRRYAENGSLSVLDGLSIGLKDLINLAGEPTTGGSRVIWTPSAAQDAVIAGQLRALGANLDLGKLNLHEYAYGPTGSISAYGAVSNPYDMTRMAGGSSSGSAAAVATGVVTAAIGTDTGGSIRIPAALCGVVGFKPTYGSLSLQGIVPLSWTLDHVGPLAQSVADLRVLLDSLQKRSRTSKGRPNLSDLRIYWPQGREVSTYDVALGEYVDDAISRITETMGWHVERGELWEVDTMRLAQSIILGSEALSVHVQKVMDPEAPYDPRTRQRLIQGGAHSAVEYLQALHYRQTMIRQYDRFMASYDAIMLPTVPVIAPVMTTTEAKTPWGESQDVKAALTRLTSPFNFLGLPALSIPWGFFMGLPVGLQLVGRRHADDFICELGEVIEERFPESLLDSPKIPHA